MNPCAFERGSTYLRSQQVIVIAMARLTFALPSKPVKINKEEPESVKLGQKIAKKHTKLLDYDGHR